MSQMRLIGKKYKKCECCSKYEYAYFFKWYSIITEEYLCTICFKCAKRELFGNSPKNKEKYNKWLKNLKEK